MTRKDWQLIARVLGGLPIKQRRDLADRLADVFLREYPNFDCYLWKAACEGSDKKTTTLP